MPDEPEPNKAPAAVNHAHKLNQLAKKVGGEYELGKTIGKGHFSKVKYAVHAKTKEKVAIKIMERKAVHAPKRQLVSKKAAESESTEGDASAAKEDEMEEQLKREICIMQRLKHPNIVQLKKVFQTKRHVYLVMELVTGGELFDKIVEAKRFDEATARTFFTQLIMGTRYCHAHGVAHRDLKPENLLLDENGTLKITDFGLAHSQSQQEKLTTMCGTPEYVAPEVLIGNGYSGFTADVWSCGVILYVMLAGSLPFRDSPQQPVFDKIRHAQYEMKPFFSDTAKDLISKLLVADPEARLTIAGILAHPWLQLSQSAQECEPVVTPGREDIATCITEFYDEEADKPEAPTAEGPFDMLDELTRRISSLRSSFSERNTKFGMKGQPEQVTPMLLEVLESCKAHPEKKGPFLIKGSVDVPAGGIITYVATVHASATEGVSVVEVRRGRGDTMKFQEFYRELLTLLHRHPLNEGANAESEGGSYDTDTGPTATGSLS